MYFLGFRYHSQNTVNIFKNAPRLIMYNSLLNVYN